MIFFSVFNILKSASDQCKGHMQESKATLGISAIVFDLGGVLMDWDPRHLYRKLFDGDEAAMEEFLATVCTAEWIRQQDMGLPVANAVARLARRYPDQASLIEAYDERWEEMLAGPIEESVSVLEDLRQRDLLLYGLTNLPDEKFQSLRERLEFLDWFEAVVVSGMVGVAKPDPEIYLHLLETYHLAPERSLYIDDVLANVEGAKALGFVGLYLQSPTNLRADLVELALL